MVPEGEPCFPEILITSNAAVVVGEGGGSRLTVEVVSVKSLQADL